MEQWYHGSIGDEKWIIWQRGRENYKESKNSILRNERKFNEVFRWNGITQSCLLKKTLYFKYDNH